MAAWQRNSSPPEYLHAMRPSQRTVLETPDSLHNLLPSGTDGSKVQPVFRAVHASNQREATPVRSELAEANDMAFLCTRKENERKNGWTAHNAETCSTGAEHEQSVVGLMPILNAPAYDWTSFTPPCKDVTLWHCTGPAACRHHSGRGAVPETDASEVDPQRPAKVAGSPSKWTPHCNELPRCDRTTC